MRDTILPRKSVFSALDPKGFRGQMGCMSDKKEHSTTLEARPDVTVLDTSAAALYVGLSASTMSKLRLSGNGPVFLKLGRRCLYSRADLDAWLASCRRRSTSDAGDAA